MKKSEFHSLKNDINLIIEIPERVNTLDIIHLKELVIHIEERKFELFNSLNNQLINLKAENYPKYLKEEDYYKFRKSNTSQWGTNGIQLDQLESILKNRIKFLEESKPNYKRLIFDNLESELFFKYIVDHWIRKGKYKKTTINYVFRKMWYKNDNKIDFNIISTSTNFALYWTETYSDIYIFPDYKNPKFKDLNSISLSYETKFNEVLSEYLRGNETGD